MQTLGNFSAGLRQQYGKRRLGDAGEMLGDRPPMSGEGMAKTMKRKALKRRNMLKPKLDRMSLDRV